jgi:DNA primase
MTSNWIDFKELRSKLKFIDVLNFYKVEVKVKGDRASCICPLPGHSVKEGKRRASFSCHLQKGVFQCFSCHAKGNLIDFGVFMDGGHPDDPGAFRRTAVKLAQQFGIHSNRGETSASSPRLARGLSTSKAVEPGSGARGEKEKAISVPPPTPAPDTPPATSVVSVIVNAPLDFELKHLDPDHPYLIDRGFTPETIQRFGLGWCGKGLMRNRIAIPLHDPDGKLVGYAGRLVEDAKVSNDCPKYLLPGARERDGKRYEFRKSHLLYGLHHLARKVNDLIVVEGFPSVWWLHQHGYGTAVALMGSSVSTEQIDLMLGRLTEEGRLWIFTDEDDAGAECAKSLVCNMASRRWVKWIRSGEEGKQPTDFSAGALAALLWQH